MMHITRQGIAKRLAIAHNYSSLALLSLSLSLSLSPLNLSVNTTAVYCVCTIGTLRCLYSLPMLFLLLCNKNDSC